MTTGIAGFCRRIIDDKRFPRLTGLAIGLSALLLGLEATPSFVARFGDTLKFFDAFVLGFFIFEISVKILAEGRYPHRYFKDGWNTLDFIIVASCLVPSGSSALAVFRLVRVLRILRLVTSSPRLQQIVSALLKSVPSMGYVAFLLFIHLYMFGVLGTFLFAKNDPVHFGSLGNSLLTLFQVLTLEGWADILRIQILGCDKFGYEAFAEACRSPQPSPVAAIAYFISFIVLGTMIILNLLIGVFVNGMAEAGNPVEPERATG